MVCSTPCISGSFRQPILKVFDVSLRMLANIPTVMTAAMVWIGSVCFSWGEMAQAVLEIS